MNHNLKEKIENLLGEIKLIDRLAEQGCTSEVCKIVTAEREYVLKSSFKEKYRAWLKKEANVLKTLNNVEEISVPRYFGFIEEEDSSHLLMSYENGISLTTALNNASSPSEKKKLIRNFGRFLQLLHEEKTIDVFREDRDWLELQLEKAQQYVVNGQTEGSAKLLEQLRVNRPKPVQQTMIHGDCTTDNILVINGKYFLFIDVAGMTIGDPRYDESLAIRSFILNQEYLQAFYEGYNRNRVSEKEFRYFDEGLYEFF